MTKAIYYNGQMFRSRRRALRAKREAGDREGRPTLRRRGDRRRKEPLDLDTSGATTGRWPTT